MEGSRPAGERRSVLETDPLGQLTFEEIDVRAKWGEPVGVEGVQQHLAFLRPGIGRR